MEFALNEQQRDFAASIDAALGAADLPGVVRAWAAGDVAPGRKVWQQLANLGVTALGVAEKFDGLGASPVDLVVALERLGRWCVPARSPNPLPWHRFCWLMMIRLNAAMG